MSTISAKKAKLSGQTPASDPDYVLKHVNEETVWNN